MNFYQKSYSKSIAVFDPFFLMSADLFFIKGPIFETVDSRIILIGNGWLAGGLIKI